MVAPPYCCEVVQKKKNNKNCSGPNSYYNDVVERNTVRFFVKKVDCTRFELKNAHGHVGAYRQDENSLILSANNNQNQLHMNYVFNQNGLYTSYVSAFDNQNLCNLNSSFTLESQEEKLLFEPSRKRKRSTMELGIPLPNSKRVRSDIGQTSLSPRYVENNGEKWSPSDDPLYQRLGRPE